MEPTTERDLELMTLTEFVRALRAKGVEVSDDTLIEVANENGLILSEDRIVGKDH